MARPGGKEVGRVNIRAVPDSTKFRKDLKVMLERAERTTSVSIPAEADTSGAEAALRRFQKDWNGRKVTLSTAVNSAAASGILRFISRPRIAEIIVNVRKESVAKALALLSSLSGASLFGDIGRSIERTFLNLGSNLPKIALVAASVASIIALTLTSLGGLATLAGGLNNVFGIFVAAPGILTGLAVGGTALGLALADVSKQLAVLGPDFQRLQNLVSDDFWAVARRPIIDFVRSTLPELTDGLRGTAGAVGGWAATVVSSIQTAFGGGRITAMFAPLIESINIAATGALGFAQGIAVLGQVGGSYLPRLAQWAADLSNRFGAFLLQIEQTGQLQALIEAGISAAQQLGSALFSIGSILSGIADAATAAGGGGLATFASVLATVAGIVNSPAFQSTLTAIFAGAAAGAQGLATALGPIGQMLQVLAPIISGVLANAGQVVGSVLGQIATALQAPAFQTGLALFFEGLLDGILAVAPALPALASAFGVFLGFVGRLAGVLGPLLGGVLTAMAPVFESILTAVEPLLPVLGDALLSIFTSLAPIFAQLVQTLLPPIVSLISTLIPLLMPIIQAILPIVAALLPPIAALITALLPIIEPILSILTPILELLGAVLVPILTILSPLIQVLAGVLTIVANLLSGAVKSGIALVTGLLTGDLAGAVRSVNQIWSDAWNSIGSAFEDIWNGILGFAKVAFNTLSGLLEGLANSIVDGVNGVLAGINSVAAGIKDATGGAIDIKLGKLPHVRLPRLALGADVVGPTLALLGENRPERVTDVGLGNKALSLTNRLAQRVLALSSRPSGEGGDTFQVYEAVSAEATAMAIAARRNRRAS